MAQNELHCIKLPGGMVSTDPGEIQEAAAQFYTELYEAEEVDKQQLSVLHRGLPQLSPEDRAALDSALSLQELTEAAPGVDGLPADIF